MPEVDVARLATSWEFRPLAAFVIVLAGGLYFGVVRRLMTSGEPWAPVRSAAMAGASAVAIVGTQSGLGHYEDDWLWVHLIQYVLLGMVVPLLVVLSAPVTLVLETVRPAGRRSLERLLRGLPAQVLTHPLVGWCLFGGGFVATFRTSLLDEAAREPLLRAAIPAYVVLAGVLFLAPLLSVHPPAAERPHLIRLLTVLAAFPFFTVVAVTMISAPDTAAPVSYPRSDDRLMAASLLWAIGEIFAVVVSGIVMYRWWQTDERSVERELARLP